MKSGWKYLGEGRNRIVYLLPGGRNVIKIPLNHDGGYDNWSEAYHSKKNGWLLRCQKAKCRLIPKSYCLIMEYVEPSFGTFTSPLPEWCAGVDCCQVGYTKNGQLVAYDYA